MIKSSEPSEHKPDAGEVDEGDGDSVEVFVVLGEAAAESLVRPETIPLPSDRSGNTVRGDPQHIDVLVSTSGTPLGNVSGARQ